MGKDIDCRLLSLREGLFRIAAAPSPVGAYWKSVSQSVSLADLQEDSINMFYIHHMRKKAKDLLLARIPLQRGPKETVWLEFSHAELVHTVREGAWQHLDQA
ncbi:uncharacterized protein ACIBXB_009782 isoform 1-T1 [Morphnus guianensis]